ncbi:MAG: ankyrin repeat domain-containing protein [Terriglobales bacterium]
MSRQLPPNPSLEQLKKQAKGLLKRQQAADSEALTRIREYHPRWRNLSERQVAALLFSLADAQLVIASEYGFSSWAKLQSHVKTLEAASSTAEAVASLRDAAGKGDLVRLNTLLDAHPELIDERGGEGGRTPLHHAVFGNSEAAVKVLLVRGANPNIRCEGDNAYPLHFAVEKHQFPIIRLLVEHGADTVGEGDYHELGVIGWATAWDYAQATPDIVAYLLGHGARHNIFSAVAVGETEVIRELVARTPNDLERRMNGTVMRSMPLHLAVMKNQPTALTTLLDLGANTESIDEARFSALDLAAFYGRHDLAQVLLERGAKVRLPAAVALRRTTDVERLLRRDPGTLKPGGRWGHLIVRASERAPGDVIEMLIRNGASMNVRDDPKTSIDATSGYTPLHAAAWYGNLSAIDVLMRHGADVRAREEKYHGTPAGWADYSGHKEARDLILRGPSWTSKTFAWFFPANSNPLILNGSMDHKVVIGIAVSSLLAGMLCGALPAWRSAHAPAIEVLKAESASISGGSRNRKLLSGLVVAQIALSLPLLVCSGLFLRTLRNLAGANPGFEQDHILTASVGLNIAGYSHDEEQVIRHKILDRVSVLPGVKVASLTDWIPMTLGHKGDDAYPEGYVPHPHESLQVYHAEVAPRYFESLHIPILEGREFTPDDDEKAPRVLIVDQTAARRYWPGQDPLGKKLRIWGGLFTVVGVARNSTHIFVNESPEPIVYMSFFQVGYETIVQVKTEGNPVDLAPAVENAIHEIDTRLPVFDVRPMRESTQMASSFAVVQSALAGMFALIGLVLAVTGIYGVVAYRTQMRTHEIGVRMALGASRVDVLRLVLLQGLWLTGIGMALGLAFALGLTRFIARLLYGIGANDPVTVVSVVMLLGAMSLLACYFPAHRAMRRNPVTAIREL